MGSRRRPATSSAESPRAVSGYPFDSTRTIRRFPCARTDITGRVSIFIDGNTYFEPAAARDRGPICAPASRRHRVDLVEFDSEPANLDLVIGAAPELDRSGFVPAQQVSGAVHALTGAAEEVGDEPGRGKVRTVAITVGETRTGQIQLADAAGRDGSQPRIEHQGRSTVLRGSDGDRPVVLQDIPVGDRDTLRDSRGSWRYRSDMRRGRSAAPPSYRPG